MSKLAISVFLNIIACFSFAQNQAIDSLISTLKNQHVDSEAYFTCLQIAKIYSDSAYDKSLTFFNKALDIAEKTSDRKKVAYIYHQIGYMYLRKGEFPTALVNFNNALEIHQYQNNRKGIGLLLNDIGLIYKTWGKYDKALENYIQALKIFDEIGDVGSGAMASNNIGQIFYYRGEYEKAIEYFTKYLDVNKKNNVSRAVAGAANNIASAYLELQKYDAALRYYVQAMRVYDSLGIKLGVAIIKDNIGSLFLRRNQYNNALLYCSDAIRMFEEIGSKPKLCISLQNVGIAYSKLNQPDQAIKYLSKSLEIATALNQKETKKDVYEALSEAYAQKRMFENAYEYHKHYVQIKDSLFNSETIQKIETLQAEYNAQKREKELVDVSQKIHSQRVILIISAGLLILFVFLVALLIRENQHKKTLIKKTEEQSTFVTELVKKTNLVLLDFQKEKINLHKFFNSFWENKTSLSNGTFTVPALIESNLVIAFISKGNKNIDSEILTLSLIDFLGSISNLNEKESLATMFEEFLYSKHGIHYLKANQVNIDFWVLNHHKQQFKLAGKQASFFTNSQKTITKIHEIQNQWINFEKGNCFYFCVVDNLQEFGPKDKEILEFTINKTIQNTLDIPFDEQKELFGNSIELIEAGSETGFGISLYSFMV